MSAAQCRHRECRRAFTVFELAIVIAIIAVLAAVTVPVVSRLRQRAQRVQCMANLKNLHVAADLYLQDNNQWPQITLAGEDDSDLDDYARRWIAALAPYHVTPKSWICPTIENSLGNPDYLASGNERVDYFAMSFDDKPMTPHKWPGMPWFAEHGDVHGNGNLMIFADGSISDLKSVAAGAK